MYKEEKVFSHHVSRTSSNHPTATGYLEQSVFYSEIRFTDLPRAPYVHSLSHPISLLPSSSRVFIVRHARLSPKHLSPINEMQFVVYNYGRSSGRKISRETIKLSWTAWYEFAPHAEIACFAAKEIHDYISIVNHNAEYSAFLTEPRCQRYN